MKKLFMHIETGKLSTYDGWTAKLQVSEERFDALLTEKVYMYAVLDDDGYWHVIEP